MYEITTHTGPEKRKSRRPIMITFRLVSHGVLWCAVFFSTLFGAATYAQVPDGLLQRRISRVSNFEFALLNDGTIWGSEYMFFSSNPPFLPLAHWPRGSFHMGSYITGGLIVSAQKNGRLLVSDAGGVKQILDGSRGPFNEMVPGWVGDPLASGDPVFNGEGWRYVNDPNYIVYSSVDYDSVGVDTSGSNFHDWPIRVVNGRRQYVPDPLERRVYPPVYLSDEDMFCVFKDTDTRADPIYTGPNGPSVPIGVEIHSSAYSWGNGPAKDIVLFKYDVINKSGVQLDSCYLIFMTALKLQGPAYPGGDLRRTIHVYEEEPWRNLTYVKPTEPAEWSLKWTATAVPPTMGFSLLESPVGYKGLPTGLRYAVCYYAVSYYQSQNKVLWLGENGTDSIYYRVLTDPRVLRPEDQFYCDSLGEPTISTGPFPMAPGDTAHLILSIIFSDSLGHLLLLDDFIRRVLAADFQRPVPPPAPRLTGTGLNRAVKLSWDESAESATDLVIPEEYGDPFFGYRLERSIAKDGPFVEIANWTRDSALVYEYLDRGEDLPAGQTGAGGLKNNVTYYYRLLSFDEGSPILKLDPMDSEVIEGVNSISVIPTTEPANATSGSSDGALSAGTLGDVSVPTLIPTNTTNFNRLLAERTLQLSMTATTNGITYTLPVTIKDTISGREHNAVIDPDLQVHGSPDVAGIKEGTALIEDVFGIGAANITMSYSFEQLAEPFHLTDSIEGQADCPIIIGDSLSVTGLQLISPYTSAEREIILEFLPGGIDTGSVIFNRFYSYLTVRITDAITGKEYIPEVDWTIDVTGIRRTGAIRFLPGEKDRYYLTGEISNGEEWDLGHLLTMYNWTVAFDFGDHGIGSGKPSPTFFWASPHRSGTVEFQVGDRVRLTWSGGVKAVFPQDAVITLVGAAAGRTEVTDEIMEGIRIVPNPYLIRHEAQRGEPRLYFNYLPEECTVRIYTLSLDLVKTITHTQGSREEWDLTTEGGQLVASQLLIAHIEAANGKKTVKKFAVVVGR